MKSLNEIGMEAKKASRVLSLLNSDEKNNILLDIAEKLVENCEYIIAENEKDLENAKKNGIKTSMIDRLKLTKERIQDIAEGVKQVVKLDDPIGKVLKDIKRPNGLHIIKKTVPLGVLGIIYEARPNVTVDAAALALKSGNCVILRGGSEAIFSNIALVNVMKKAKGLPEGAIGLIEDTSRETAAKMMKLNKYIDVLIPRGGAGLIKTVVENSTVPVIETGSGICHTYIDKDANLDMAVNISVNAKCSRPSVCNAMETLLVHKDIAEEFLPKLVEAMPNVEIRGCGKTLNIVKVSEAKEEDWSTEYNDYILSVKIVESVDEAIEHIVKYSTGHSECIVTDNNETAEKFLNSIDVAAVYHNASTRFTDGFEFGFGAEIGISTQKTHARGPMGLEELTSSKYIIYGNGQIR